MISIFSETDLYYILGPFSWEPTGRIKSECVFIFNRRQFIPCFLTVTVKAATSCWTRCPSSTEIQWNLVYRILPPPLKKINRRESLYRQKFRRWISRILINNKIWGSKKIIQRFLSWKSLNCRSFTSCLARKNGRLVHARRLAIIIARPLIRWVPKV